MLLLLKIFAQVTYDSYIDRRTLEERGNLGLYSDASGKIHTFIDGEKIFFKWGSLSWAYGEYFTKGWYGSHTWDFYEAERRGENILLITRTGFDHLDNSSNFQQENRTFEVLTFSKDGNLLNPSNSPEYSLSNSSHVQYLETLFEITHSELEAWAISNETLIREYMDSGITGPYLNESHPNSNGQLEEWAFYKYQEMFPNRPMLQGFGAAYETPYDYKFTGGEGPDVLKSYSGINFGKDLLEGGEGSDQLFGYRGADVLDGGNGDDLVRAGNGRDVIDGGDGSDAMYGGFGLNTFEDSDDGEIDQLFFKSDQHSYNWIYDKAGNSPNGEKADKIMELDPFDEIFVQGVETEELDFGKVVHYSNLGETLDGIGIYALGTLEAVYVGDNLDISQLESMTQGII